jgi:AbrB family looped-hinge helix DNA binding protein
VAPIEQQTRTRIGGKGRVLIPASFRATLGLKIGDEINLRIEDNEIRISTLKGRLEGRGSVCGSSST